MSLLPPDAIVRSKSSAKTLVNHEQMTMLHNGSRSTVKSTSTILLPSRLSGQQNPSHKEQLENFVQAGTPLVAWYDELENVPVGVTEKLTWNTWTSPLRTSLIELSGNFPTQSMTDSSVSSISAVSASNLALSGLALKIDDARTTFHGGTFVGELRDTLRMLRSPAKTLRTRLPVLLNSYGKNIRKGTKRREANRIARDTWLEWSFGVRPLLNDIESAGKLITVLVNNDSAFHDTVCKYKEKVETQLSADQQSVGPSAPFILGTRLTHIEASVRYFAGYRLNNNPLAGQPAKKLGFAPSDWLPTAWELLPWSFVVDYFTNIGDIVTSVANLSSSPRWIIKTTKLSYVRTTSFKGVTPVSFTPGPYNGSATDVDVQRGSLRHARCKVIREIYDGKSLIPSLEFQIPGMGLKWVNLAALGSMLFAKRKSINRKLT